MAFFEGEPPVEVQLAGFDATGHPTAGVLEVGAVSQPGNSFPAPGSHAYQRLAEIGNAIRSAARQDPSSKTLHAGGVYQLLWHHQVQASLDSAIERLETASAMEPNRSVISNDLAAAYILRAGEGRDPIDLIRALETLERVTKGRSDFPAVDRNRALVLEQLHLPLTLKNWIAGEGPTNTQKPRDPEPSLAPLAMQAAASRPNRDHFIEAIKGSSSRLEALVTLVPSEAWRLIFEVLLSEWSRDLLVEDLDGARDRLAEAQALAAVLAKQNGERLLFDGIRAIERARISERRAFANAYKDLHEGLERYRQSDCDGSVAALQRAEEGFRDAGSSFAALARYHQLVCQYFDNPEKASAQFEELARDPSVGSSPVLEAQAHRMAGLGFFVQGRHEEAVDSYRAALDILESARFTDGQDSLRMLLAEALDSLGQAQSAWIPRLAALRSTRSSPGTTLRHNVLFDASRSLKLQGRLSAAALFAEEMVASADRSPSIAVLADAYRSRAEILARLKRDTDARADLVKARELAEQLPRGGVRQRLSADLEIAWGSSLVSTSPDEAVEFLTSALDRYRDSGHLEQSTRIRLDRARALRRLGHSEVALVDLESAMAEIEERRTRTRPAKLRAGYFDTVQAVYDEAIDLLIESDQPDRAFEVGEAMRARGLRDEIGGGGSGPVASEAISQRLPLGVTLLEYALLPERLVTWMFQEGKLHMSTQDVRREDLEGYVRRLGTLAARGGGERAFRELSALLHNLLIEPIADRLSADHRIIFVPDRALFGVPYSGLLNSRTKRYLVEDHAISVAPSAAALIGRQPKPIPNASPTGVSILLVGNPDFDTARYPSLAPLPYSEEEVRRIAALYPQATILTGKDATRGAVLSELQRHEIVHVAAHALVHPETPELSEIVTAQSNDLPSASLTAADISTLDLSRVKLVVLATCKNLERPLQSREGLSGLTRAFLGAGVRTVVANLWDLDDRRSLLALETLHESLVRGRGPVQATREAQRVLRTIAQESEQASEQEFAGLQVYESSKGD